MHQNFARGYLLIPLRQKIVVLVTFPSFVFQDRLLHGHHACLEL